MASKVKVRSFCANDFFTLFMLLQDAFDVCQLFGAPGRFGFCASALGGAKQVNGVEPGAPWPRHARRRRELRSLTLPARHVAPQKLLRAAGRPGKSAGSTITPPPATPSSGGIKHSPTRPSATWNHNV